MQKLHETSKPKPGEIGRLLTFGRGGHTLHYSSPGKNYRHCKCQGYESPESFGELHQWWAYPKGEMSSPFGSVSIPPEGIAVVDMRAAVETKEGIEWVFRGPLVDVDLPDGECDACPQPSEVLVHGVSEQMQTLLAVHVATKATGRGSLDSVSVSEYVQGWREHGARIGRIWRNDDGTGRIEWH